MATPERPQSRASPGPSGSAPRSRFHVSRGWILFGLALLAFNIYFSSRATEPVLARPRPVQPVLPQAGERAGTSRRSPRRARRSRARSRKPERYQGSKPTTKFKTEIPAFANTDALSALLEKKGVVVNAQPLDNGPPWWESLLLGFGPTLLFLLLLFSLIRRAGNVQNVLGPFGRSRARRYQPSGDRVTFADVAGIDEAKAGADARSSTSCAIPRSTSKLGGRIPHGVLLSGPPGTGKTLLARAVAGEADVPFFSHGRLGVRRGDRRRRRLARARPLRPGEGGRAGDRLHRRARRDRPLAHLRRRPASAAATTSASRR